VTADEATRRAGEIWRGLGEPLVVEHGPLPPVDSGLRLKERDRTFAVSTTPRGLLLSEL
jgi:hypothetical protein